MRGVTVFPVQGVVTALAAMLPSLPATAAPSAGDTAWMLTSTALVLFMTIPGLALFYAGMVRVKNVLSVLMQCFAITGLVTLLWVFYGYSLAFGGEGSVWGGLGKVFLWGVGHDSVVGTIPETVYVMFQLTFAIITPTLIVGAFAERMKFSAMLWFMGAWFTLVYAPVAHWVWGEGGWLGARGILDFAGGTVVHVNAGIAGLVAALVLGRRRGYPTTPMPPHNLILTVMGASMLWVGWFGFNAGSALAADGTAGMAMLLTQIATAAAALAWMFSEWLTHGKPSVLGIVSGAVAGLVAVTPASGSVGPMGAAAIGLVAGVGCFFTATTVKRRLGYDDTLDVFGVHAMGGIIGALLTGLFCAASLGGTGFGAGVSGMGGQMVMQLLGVAVTLTYSGGMSLLILLIIRRLLGLRVSPDQELEGLDISLHDEKGYNL
jgi:Amt family ammonium transporter